MINGKTYYQILGVLLDAEDIVIRAAYRSLSQKYHPDRWNGDSKYATERMAELNRAYEILSDKAKRENYDEELRSLNKESDFNSDSDREDEFQDFYKQSEKDWKLAKEYFPAIDKYFASLKKINYGLAFAYRQTLLEKKAFSDAERIFNALKHNFLRRYFGNNPKIQEFAEILILSNQKKAALELNQTVQVLGDTIDPKILIKKISDKFPQAHFKTPEIVAAIKQLEIFKGNLHYYRSPADAKKAIRFLGGEVNEAGGIFFNDKFAVSLDGVEFDLNRSEFIDFTYKQVCEELRRYSK